MTAEEVAALGYASYEDSHRDISERDGLHEDARETMSVPIASTASCCYTRGCGAPPAAASATASRKAGWCT